MFYRKEVSTAEFISSARNCESAMFHFLLVVKKMMDNVQMNDCGSRPNDIQTYYNLHFSQYHVQLITGCTLQIRVCL